MDGVEGAPPPHGQRRPKRCPSWKRGARGPADPAPLCRPQGKSYLYFTQFRAEVRGAEVEYGMAYVSTGASQRPGRGHREDTSGDSAGARGPGEVGGVAHWCGSGAPRSAPRRCS